MTPLLRKLLGMNWVLVLLMYGLLVFGVFMIESAARHLSVPKEILNNTAVRAPTMRPCRRPWILIGSVAYFAAALVDYRWIRWLGIPFYVAGLVLMAMACRRTMVHRLPVVGLKFQPAQLGSFGGHPPDCLADAGSAEPAPVVRRAVRADRHHRRGGGGRLS